MLETIAAPFCNGLVDHVVATQRQKSAVRVQRQFGGHRQIAGLVVAQKRFRSVAGPFHRPPDAASGPDHQGELGVERTAGAEISADVVHDHADIGFRHAKYRSEIVARPHRSAGAGVQRVFAGQRIVFTDRGARLHRHAGDALHPGLEPHHMRRGGESGIDRGGVADH
jgi:hypothetical protein